MDAAAKGAAALEAKDFPAALTHYTKALINHPTSPDYYTQRSIALTRISPPHHDLAVKDAEYAVLLAQKRAKREKIQAAQIRRVVALHGVGRYADAKAVLETTVRWRPADNKPAKMEGDMWLARIENKLKNVSDEDKVSTEKEFPDVEVPSEPKLKSWLYSQLNKDGSFKFDNDTEMKETLPTATTSIFGANNTDPKMKESSIFSLAPTKVRHEWYQSPTTVTLTLYAKGVSKDACEIDIQEDSVHISFPRPSTTSSTYTFTLDPLFALIDPSQSTSKVMSTKIELILKKAQAGQKWHELEGATPLKTISDGVNTAGTAVKDAAQAAKDAVLSTLTSTTETAPSYPTSSRTGPKNWDKLAQDLTTTSNPKKATRKSKSSSTDPSDAPKSDSASESEHDATYDSDEGGGDDVDAFFKKLYKGADDDTRRAMMKSFQESNGTALSTNWKDVGAKKVEEVKSKD